MEYLLREKLEKLVQSEIEARLHMYRRDERENVLHVKSSGHTTEDLDRSNAELKRAQQERKRAADEVRIHPSNMYDDLCVPPCR